MNRKLYVTPYYYQSRCVGVEDKERRIWIPEPEYLFHDFQAQDRKVINDSIMNYIKEKYPKIYPLYDEIYNKKDISYWEMLDKEVEEYANKNGYMYVIDEELFLKNPTGKPIIINYFYYEKIRQSEKKINNV